MVVLIPTLPPVVNIFPIVFELPTADKFVVILATPAVKFVSIRLVAVILTTVRVPATFKSPDKLIEPPVIVVAAIREELIVEAVRVVIRALVVVTFVVNKFVIVEVVIFAFVI